MQGSRTYKCLIQMEILVPAEGLEPPTP
jgi:hypothetical protein